MALDNIVQSRYLTRPIVRQRNSVTLLAWSDYVATQPIPTPPDDAWIRERIIAENMPLSLDYTTVQTLGYFLQDAGTQQNILQYISEDNDTATEQTLADSNQTICGTFMPRFALTTVTDQQIEAWKEQNNVAVKGDGQQ